MSVWEHLIKLLQATEDDSKVFRDFTLVFYGVFYGRYKKLKRKLKRKSH